jgi:hypothetical protein
MFGVWVIGNSNLNIVCYLLFGAWNLFNRPLHDSFNKHLGSQIDSGSCKCLPEIGVAVSAKIDGDVIQICDSP